MCVLLGSTDTFFTACTSKLDLTGLEGGDSNTVAAELLVLYMGRRRGRGTREGGKGGKVREGGREGREGGREGKVER